MVKKSSFKIGDLVQHKYSKNIGLVLNIQNKTTTSRSEEEVFYLEIFNPVTQKQEVFADWSMEIYEVDFKEYAWTRQ